MNTKRAVCGLLFHNNKILSVSRKSNHNDFNLFGGKLEKGDVVDVANFCAFLFARNEVIL